MELAFTAEVWFWHGPAPFHLVTVPEDLVGMLASAAQLVTYGWGMVPVTVEVGGTTCRRRGRSESVTTDVPRADEQGGPDWRAGDEGQGADQQGGSDGQAAPGARPAGEQALPGEWYPSDEQVVLDRRVSAPGASGADRERSSLRRCT